MESGVRGLLVFGIPAHKDEVGSEAYDHNGVTQQGIRFIKKYAPELLVIADVCLCEYTSHGHCGLIRDGEILNDETLPLLAKASVTLAEAGADMIAPSDMMDGRVASIRKALDDAGYLNTPSLHPCIIPRSGMLHTLRRLLGTGKRTRWIRRTEMRPSGSA